MITRSITKNSLLLGVFAILTTGACVLTYQLSKERMESNQKQAIESRLNEVMPSRYYDNELLADTVTLAHPLPSRPLYLAYRENQMIGAIIPTQAKDGYGGPIDLLVGIFLDGRLSGVRVVPPHLETPGLGDAIDIKKSEWINAFTGKSLQNPTIDRWKVKKEGGNFDQFTGATITPRAVINAVKNTLLFFEEEKASIQALKASNSREISTNESAH